MSFSPGRPILVMLAVAILSGGYLSIRPTSLASADLHVWVFAQSHLPAYRALAKEFERQTGHRVSIELISSQAESMRLISLFKSDSHDVPDLAEVEIGEMGKFLRPSVDQVGFLPLTSLLERDHLLDQFVQSRFAPYSKGQAIFGVPHDVHPVALVYRRDLWDQAHVDPSRAATWEQFHLLALDFQAYWRGRGVKDRWAIELSLGKTDSLTMMLLQRHLNIVDGENQVHLADPAVADTLVRYAAMVAGPGRIAAETSQGAGLWARDFANGSVCALLAADWRIGDLKKLRPDLAGKCALMPLPRFDPDDAPTSTWGGTAIAIPRHCRDPQLSWKLLKFLYTSPQAAHAREESTDILPPIKGQWQAAAYREADPFFDGERTGLVLIDLATQIPQRNVTPYSLMGAQALSFALFRTITFVREHQSATALRPVVDRELQTLAGELRKRIQFGAME